MLWSKLPPTSRPCSTEASVAKPRKPTRAVKSLVTTMRFSPETMRRLSAVARHEGRSRTDVVTRALDLYWKRYKDNKPVELDDGTIFG